MNLVTESEAIRASLKSDKAALMNTLKHWKQNDISASEMRRLVKDKYYNPYNAELCACCKRFISPIAPYNCKACPLAGPNRSIYSCCNGLYRKYVSTFNSWNEKTSKVSYNAVRAKARKMVKFIEKRMEEHLKK